MKITQIARRIDPAETCAWFVVLFAYAICAIYVFVPTYKNQTHAVIPSSTSIAHDDDWQTPGAIAASRGEGK